MVPALEPSCVVECPEPEDPPLPDEEFWPSKVADVPGRAGKVLSILRGGSVLEDLVVCVMVEAPNRKDVPWLPEACPLPNVGFGVAGKPGAGPLLRDTALTPEAVVEAPADRAESHEFDSERWIAFVSTPVRDCWPLLPEEVADDGSG